MFAVSTGFRAAACAGYYDRLLTSGISRGKIAAAHWVASSGPGALAWLAFTGLSVGLSDGMFPASMQPGSLLAWLLVSTLGWAMGLMLPRLGAGIAWVTGILLLGTTQAGLVQMRLLTSDQTLDGVDLLAAGLTVVVCPFVLLGSPPATETPWIRGCAVLIALLALAAGLIRLANSEFPLSAR
jgi:hypothetical protein